MHNKVILLSRRRWFVGMGLLSRGWNDDVDRRLLLLLTVQVGYGSTRVQLANQQEQ